VFVDITGLNPERLGLRLQPERKDAIRALIRNNDVVYIYHNLIDAAGDKTASEGQVFEAAERAILTAELKARGKPVEEATKIKERAQAQEQVALVCKALRLQLVVLALLLCSWQLYRQLCSWQLYRQLCSWQQRLHWCW
jgi:hypothetical protein